MKYYQRLKDLREDEDLKQKTVAKVLDTSQKQYSRWETGEYPIPFENVIKLAMFYKVSIDYIAGLTNDKGGLHKKSEKNININQSHSNKPVVKIKGE